MFQKQFSCSLILFFCIATSQKGFLSRPPLCTAIESVNFKDFVQRAVTATMQLTEFYLTTSYKMQSVSSQTKIWKLQLKPFSYQRDQRRPLSSTLICISKIHYIVRKNSQNAGVNRTEKAYQCIVYTPVRSRIASNPRVYLKLPSTNFLKTTQIHVFAQLRPCQKSFA